MGPIGETIRNIRLSKGIKSIELYKSILTKQAAIRFENGLSDTTVSKFFQILERLNITLEEYEATYKEENNLDFYFINRYINLFYKKDTQSLSKLQAEAFEKYNKKQLEKYNHYVSLIELLINYLNQDKTNEKARAVIADYLMRCESWGYYEITLFINTIPHLSGDFIDSVYGRVKKKMQTHSNILRYRNEKAILLFNIIEKKLVNGENNNLQFYMNELYLLKEDTMDNMYIQTMIKYFSLLSNAVTSNSFGPELWNQIYKIIDFLKFIGLTTKSLQCENLYKQIRQYSEIGKNTKCYDTFSVDD